MQGKSLIGEEIKLWIHHHHTEASELLFGFANPEEREIFRELNRVNGVGGKTALNILGLGMDTLQTAIATEDDKILASVPGIGKKTAQKIIVDLKGSIDFSKKSETSGPQNNNDTLLISSLVNMGYDKSRVESIIGDIPTSLSLQERTVQAIRELAKN